MFNPFATTQHPEPSDEVLVQQAVAGSQAALETLLTRHSAWIYNLAVRMTGNHHDAEDATQEVLIKIATRLSTFKGTAGFRTWVYRIVKNDILSLLRRERKRPVDSFTQYGMGIDNTPDMDIPDPNSIPADLALLAEEVQVLCMMGMLLCLTPEQRFVFVLGELFGATDAFGSEILEIERSAYRKRLSRARLRVYNFMKEKCSLIHPDNPCQCGRKLKALIDDGAVSPGELRFNTGYLDRIKDVCETRVSHLASMYDEQCRQYFREHPFYVPPELPSILPKILKNPEFYLMFDLHATRLN